MLLISYKKTFEFQNSNSGTKLFFYIFYICCLLRLFEALNWLEKHLFVWFHDYPKEYNKWVSVTPTSTRITIGHIFIWQYVSILCKTFFWRHQNSYSKAINRKISVHHVGIEKSKERTSVLCWPQMNNNIKYSVKPCYFAKDISQIKQKYNSRRKKKYSQNKASRIVYTAQKKTNIQTNTSLLVSLS